MLKNSVNLAPEVMKIITIITQIIMPAVISSHLGMKVDATTL